MLITRLADKRTHGNGQTHHVNNFVTQLGIYNLPVGAPNYIPPSLFPALAAEVVRQCDRLLTGSLTAS